MNEFVERDEREQSHPIRRTKRGKARVATIVVALIVLVAAIAGAASLAALSWNNPGGGSAATAGNWAPAQVPTASDDLTFNLNNTYNVTFNASTTASRTHTYRRGDVTLSATNAHTVSNGITVGDVSGDVATMTHTTGTVTSNAAIVVGDANGSTGTLNVDDDDADLVTTTTLGDLIVGNNGDGTLEVTGGGLVRIADRLTAGSNGSSSADLLVNGKLIFSPFTRSTLEVDGTAQAHAIGAGGDVTMEVSNGGRALFDGSVNVAQGSASTSTLTIGGSGINVADMSVGGDLGIARNASAGSAGGIAIVNVEQFGILDVGGVLNVGGDPDGGTATLHLAAGGAIDAAGFNLGAGGTLDFDGGTLDVNGGTFGVTNPSANLVLGGANNPVVTLQSGCVATLQNNSGNRAFTVGGGAGATDADADFNLLSGSSLTVTSGDGVLGDATDDGGMIVSASTMTMPPASSLSVGHNGAGALDVALGADIVLGSVFVAKNSGSTGSMTIDGAGTTASVQELAIGGSSTVSGGTAGLTISGGAECTVDGTGSLGRVTVWDNGDLVVSNSTLDATEFKIHGGALITNGTVRGGVFNVFNTAVFASGTIDGPVNSPGALNSITAIGDLTLGAGLFNLGLLECDNHTVTILSATSATLGDVQVGGGELILSSSGEIEAGYSLSGFGVVDGDIDLVGAIVATNSGLSFEGIVNGTGEGCSGTFVRFTNGGGFVGAGTIDADVFIDSTSSLTATGPLTLGNILLATRVISDGRLDIGAQSVTIRSAGFANLGRSTTLAGGTLTYGPGAVALHLSGADTLSGFGTVNSRLIGPSSENVIIASGPLTIGYSEITGFNYAGEMHVGSHVVTLLDLSTVDLGVLTTIDGGTLATNSVPVVVPIGGTLSGSGAVAEAFLNAGTIEVGDPIGTLTVAGGFTNTGTIAVQVGGGGSIASGGDGAIGEESVAKSASVVWDQLNVAGTAVLSGTLRIGLLPGASVDAGQRIPIITCGSRNGVFATIVFEDPYLDDVFDVEYTPFAVELVATVATGVALPPAGDPSNDVDPGASASATPTAYALRVVGANPSTLASGTTFEYDIPTTGAPVSLAIFDASGRLVSRLVDGGRPAGRHPVAWRPADAGLTSSGVYFLRMDATGFRDTKKLVLMR